MDDLPFVEEAVDGEDGGVGGAGEPALADDGDAVVGAAADAALVDLGNDVVDQGDALGSQGQAGVDHDVAPGEVEARARLGPDHVGNQVERHWQKRGKT